MSTYNSKHRKKSKFDILKMGVSDLSSSAASKITSGMSSLESGISSGLNSLASGLSTGATNVASGLSTGATKLASGLSTGATNVASGLSTGATKAASGTKQALTYAQKAATESAKNSKGFVGDLGGHLKSLGTDFKNEVGAIQGSIAYGTQSVLSGTQGLASGAQKTSVFYTLISIIVFLTIVFIIIFSDVNILNKLGPSQLKDKIIADTFIILFFSLLVVSLCVIFLPSMKEFRKLFDQIGNITYIILYTIFAILFYTMVPNDILNNYSYLLNPLVIGLGAFAFYKGVNKNYMEEFNISYERIKMLIIFLCLITLIIVFYNTNPGNMTSNFFGPSLLITIIIAIFAFLYLIIIMTLSDDANKENKSLFSGFSRFGSYGTVAFFIFLTIVTIMMSSNREKLFENKQKTSALLIILLIIFILWSVLLGSNLFSDTEVKGDITRANIFKKSLLMLFGLVISGLIIYWITSNLENLSTKSSITKFTLNLLLVAVILGLIYKTIHVSLPAGNTKKNAFFNLIKNTILYIPCLLSGTFDWIGKQSTGKDSAGSLMMLLVAILLFVAYFKTPSIFNFVSTQGGNQLVNNPVYTDTQYNLGNYQDLNGGKEDFDYQYAISCWVFVDAAGPNMNENYNKYTSLLNFGEKPNILYNGRENSLMITMQQKDLKNKTTNKLTDFDDNGNRIIYINKDFLLQKWNNIIINYNGGTLDIFLNGQLVKSAIEVVPYYTYDNLTIGENNGIKGGICNVVYFRNTLTSQNIYYIYNSLNGRDPPVLNDSNKSILVKDLNETVSSANSVISKNT